MKAMKSKIAKGPRMRVSVFLGYKDKTYTGLTKSMLTKSKAGKIVSKSASAAGKKSYKNIKPWTQAVSKAKKELNITGFVAINGKTAKGKSLYAKAKAIYNA